MATFAADIGASLIAEGVATAADLALLRASGLPILVQGFAVARSGPAWPAINDAASGVSSAPPLRDHSVRATRHTRIHLAASRTHGA